MTPWSTASEAVIEFYESTILKTERNSHEFTYRWHS